MRVVCTRTGKASFGTYGAALTAAVAAAHGRRHPLRAYRCEFCGCFHLSSRPYDPTALRRSRTR